MKLSALGIFHGFGCKAGEGELTYIIFFFFFFGGGHCQGLRNYINVANCTSRALEYKLRGQC